MTGPSKAEPPREFLWYSLAEARALLVDLDQARRTLLASGHLAGAVVLGEEMRLLQRKLDDTEPEGDADGR